MIQCSLIPRPLPPKSGGHGNEAKTRLQNHSLNNTLQQHMARVSLVPRLLPTHESLGMRLGGTGHGNEAKTHADKTRLGSG